MNKTEWETSYEKKENWIVFPKEQIVKFLSRYVRRKISANAFKDLIELKVDAKALDLGCGIGRQTVLLKEFGFDAYGIDISEIAINAAKKLCKDFGHVELTNNFSVIENNKIDFADNYFQVAISESVLDSMPFEIAKNYVKEIDRTTKGFFFCSLISGDRVNGGNFSDEVVVDSGFENGTIQSYFTVAKIKQLFAGTTFQILSISLIKEDFVGTSNFNDRYFIVSKNN